LPFAPSSYRHSSRRQDAHELRRRVIAILEKTLRPEAISIGGSVPDDVAVSTHPSPPILTSLGRGSAILEFSR
jgi:hypothetical protein